MSAVIIGFVVGYHTDIALGVAAFLAMQLLAEIAGSLDRLEKRQREALENR